MTEAPSDLDHQEHQHQQRSRNKMIRQEKKAEQIAHLRRVRKGAGLSLACHGAARRLRKRERILEPVITPEELIANRERR